MYCTYSLGPNLNGLVTRLSCQGFVLALFQITTANTIDSEHTRDYTNLFPVCKVEILQVTVNKIEKFYHLFRSISDNIQLQVLKIGKKGTLVSDWCS